MTAMTAMTAVTVRREAIRARFLAAAAAAAAAAAPPQRRRASAPPALRREAIRARFLAAAAAAAAPRRRARKALTPHQRCSVAAGQGWRCNDCRVLFKALWHVDHVVPLADGGADGAANMQALCAECHGGKTAGEARARAAEKSARRP